MMFLAVRDLSKSYGAINVLNQVFCIINTGDRIGIVGPNGVGKSTLLKILVGQEEAEAGTFSYAPSIEVGYLPQIILEFYGHSIQDLISESVGNLRQLEERMRQIESSLTTADEEQLTSLLEEYAQISTKFQDRGGYDLDYKIDIALQGLGISYLKICTKRWGS
ncbi:MAG TPA: ATP-binding cassette domain-containing protein [Ktedonobacteraceae bacterium]|nr:ATP-binding cassette domain-containing protein [Ktedonobacteraceae bacterium]